MVPSVYSVDKAETIKCGASLRHCRRERARPGNWKWQLRIDRGIIYILLLFCAARRSHFYINNTKGGDISRCDWLISNFAFRCCCYKIHTPPHVYKSSSERSIAGSILVALCRYYWKAILRNKLEAAAQDAVAIKIESRSGAAASCSPGR